jgi:DNA-binding GntR family transcriptional regulator
MITGRDAKSVPTDQEIYNRIYLAILERRLPPGMPLRENELATMFGVGRTKVRQALVKLVEVGVVEVARNRGASVAAPTRRQAAQVFNLRAILEPAIAGQLAQTHTPEQIDRLRVHLGREEAARVARDEAMLIRHTGEFHLLLAAQLGNPFIDRLLKGLEALTCLSILSYSRRETSACLPHEHIEILEAIAAGNATLTSRLMAAHLGHVRAELDLDERPVGKLNLGEALGLGGSRGPVSRRDKAAK